jgi:5'-nucleotidase (lipoprotein e(P4) family)
MRTNSPGGAHADVMRAALAAAVLAVAVSGVACRTAAPQPPATAPATTAKTEPLPDSLRWVRDAAEYRAAVLQTYRAATAAVTTASAGRAAGTWAVILDADETIISNLQYQIERAQVHQPYTPESWRAWVARREATALPGAAAFLARVRELGGRIAIVTNRLGSECPDTESVFRARSLVYDMMLCRPDGTPSDKNPRFAAVAAGTTPAGGPPLQVIAYLGDNILDFPSLSQASARKDDGLLAPFGVSHFVIPNPMYGSWQP